VKSKPCGQNSLVNLKAQKVVAQTKTKLKQARNTSIKHFGRNQYNFGKPVMIVFIISGRQMAGASDL
jgi:hypothetical protein